MRDHGIALDDPFTRCVRPVFGAKSTLCGICGVQSRCRTGFLQVFGFYRVSIVLLVVQLHSCVIRGTYIGPLREYSLILLRVKNAVGWCFCYV